MLSKLKEFFSLLPDSSPVHDPKHARRLAAAALLIDVAKADYAEDPRELLAVRNALQLRFNLSKEEIDTLVALASSEADTATSAYQFTRVINDSFSDPEKSALIEAMWEVAFADGNLDRYEEHLIRKIAELIYVPHSEFIRTKLAVQRSIQSD